MKKNRNFLYVAVFTAGMTSLAIELAASRLLGNVVGSSNLVWACIIGLILIYLTAGYFLGGRWADRSPSPRTFYQILAWAAFSIGVVPLVSRPVLRFSADAFDQLQMAVLFGSFVAVLILFVVPVTLLGTASPFAIRLALEDSSQAGRVSGKIYGISTLGSFVGTFLPVLVLIPLIGTYRTFLTFSVILMGVAFIGLWLSSGWKAVLPLAWMPFVLVLLAFIGLRGTDKNSTGMIYETESAYNYIQVLEVNGTRYLRLNDGQGFHSEYNPDTLNYEGPWEQVLVGPFFNQPPYDPSRIKRIAILGLAAGTTARQATAVFGAIPIDGYEIDPVIIAVGQEYFAMTQPNLNPIAQDARYGLAHSNERYSIISVDAYRPPYIPWHLTTQEFFALVRDHLTDDGVMVINVGRGPTDRNLVDGLGSTIATVFPSIYVVDIPGTFNSILFATVQPTRAENLSANLLALANRPGTHPLLLQTLQTAVSNLMDGPQKVTAFTDDLAPIEWLTNNLVLDFVFSGGVETLK
jgi:predicted membrane-bound spermidine synthase